MSRGKQRFHQADVVKAVRAATKAGLSVARVEISADGTIVVIAGQAASGQDAGDKETSASLRKLL